MDDVKKIVPRNLQYLLSIKGGTKTDVCAAIHVPQVTVYAWFNGSRYPRQDGLEALAHYFGVTVSDLLDERLPDHYSANTVIKKGSYEELSRRIYDSEELRTLCSEIIAADSKTRKLVEYILKDFEPKKEPSE